MRCAGRGIGRAIGPRRFRFRKKSGDGTHGITSLRPEPEPPKPEPPKAVPAAAKERAAAIAKLRRKGDWQGALSILFGGPRDLVLFTSAANVCAKSSTWRTAVALLEKLQICALQPDVIFWSSLGDAYSSVGKWEHALWALLQEPQSARLDLTAVSYASALTACERVSLWEKVLNLLEVAKASNLVNAFSYSSAIVACGSARWQRALELWEEMTRRGPAPNVVAMNATLTALQRGRRWPLALQLLDAVDADATGTGSLSGDAVTVAAVATAESWEWGLRYLLRATDKGMRLGPSAFSSVARQMGHQGAWEQAEKLLTLLRKYPTTVKFEVWCSVLWAMDVSGVPLTLDTAPASTGLGPSIYRACGRKELALLDFVVTHVPRGDLRQLLAEVRRFAVEREWLKVAGGSKARLLEAILRPGDRVLELGCFVGYSALLMAQRLRRLGGGGKVVTCEVNAVSALVARQLIAWAKAQTEVEVKVGLAADWLQHSDQLGVPDVVVLDHRGARYHEDLSTLEALLRTNSRILADNVLSPGAPGEPSYGAG